MDRQILVPEDELLSILMLPLISLARSFIDNKPREGALSGRSVGKAKCEEDAAVM